MKTQRTHLLLATIAVAVTFGSAKAALATPPGNGPFNKGAVCCTIGNWDWLAPAPRVCRKQGGKVVPLSTCRFGKSTNGSRARSSASTKHSAPGPHARSAGPQPRSHASTHGTSGKPPARNHRGNPATKPNGSNSKPNGSNSKPNSSGSLPAGCKPRMKATRYGALSKQLGIESARLSWQLTSQAAYGMKYKYKHAENRQEACAKGGGTYTCTVWANPCPPH